MPSAYAAPISVRPDPNSPQTVTRAQAEALYERGFDDPAAVHAEAMALIAEGGVGDDPVTTSIVWRAAALGAREMYRIDEALDCGRRAVDSGARSGDRRVHGWALMSLAATTSYGGAMDDVFALMDQAEALLEGGDLVIALNQRAGLLHRAGRSDDALTAFDRALELAHTSGEPITRAEVLLNRGVLLGYLGRIDTALADTAEAAATFEHAGRQKRHIDMIHNLGWLAGRRGDLVGALRSFEDASTRMAALGLESTAVDPDLCEVLVAAGLLDDAQAAVGRWIDAFRADGNTAGLATAVSMRARHALVAGDYERAIRDAGEAAELHAGLGRDAWAADSDVLRLNALARAAAAFAHASGDRRPSGLVDADVDRALSHAASLEDAGLAAEAAEARLVAAEITSVLGQFSRSVELLADSTGAESMDGMPGRVDTALRRALLHAKAEAADGRVDVALATCRRALRSYLASTLRLAGTEMRAHAAVHAAALAAYGVSLAIAEGSSAAFLAAVDAQRANSLLRPPVLPPDDDELTRLLSAYRALEAEHATPATATPSLRAEAADLAERVRRRARLVDSDRIGGVDAPDHEFVDEFGADSTAPVEPEPVAGFLDDVRDACAQRFATMVAVGLGADGRLAACLVREDGATLVPLALDAGELAALQQRARAALASRVRAAAASTPNAAPESGFASRRLVAAGRALDSLLARIDTALVRPLIEAESALDARSNLSGSNGRSLVLCLPTNLVSLPWGMLPSLAARPVVLAPSLRLWLRHSRVAASTVARPASAAPPSGVLVAVGPGVRTGDREADRVAERYGSALVLRGPRNAVAERFLEALPTMPVAHIACHGSFRSDSPMFSSLRLDDGPLYLYDVERAAGVAGIVVLSACHAALTADRPGDELFGLATALLAKGAASVVASVAPVADDDALVAAMAALHERLAAGVPPAVALSKAGVVHAALQSFVCLGS